MQIGELNSGKALLFFAVGVYFYVNENRKKQEQETVTIRNLKSIFYQLYARRAKY